MQRRWIGPLLLLGVALFAAAPAPAQIVPTPTPETPGAVLTRWGLAGTWAVRCDLPPSASNSHLRYVVEPDGRAFHLRDLGDQYERDRSEILAASIAADGAIHVTINFESLKQVRVVEFAKVAGNPKQVRAISNRQVDGPYTVKDGRFTSNGRETPAQIRCD